MASTTAASGWLRGRVKAVLSGDCLVIMGSTRAEIPPEKTITLSSLIAPRLVSRHHNSSSNGIRLVPRELVTKWGKIVRKTFGDHGEVYHARRFLIKHYDRVMIAEEAFADNLK